MVATSSAGVGGAASGWKWKRGSARGDFPDWEAGEFGVADKGTKLAALLFFISDVHSLGLKSARGLVLTEAYYWDLNDETRSFAKRFTAKRPGKIPTQVQAGAYSATLHYLKSLGSVDPKNGKAIVAEMKKKPTDDPAFRAQLHRAETTLANLSYISSRPSS